MVLVLRAPKVCGLDKEPFHRVGLLQMLSLLTAKEVYLCACEAFTHLILLASSLSQLLFYNLLPRKDLKCEM